MKVGDLVRFRHTYRAAEEGVFLVTHIAGDGNWVVLLNGPQRRYERHHGVDTLHSWTLLELVNESR